MKFRNRSKQIFIISSPRSGTTWLSKMLNAHPQVYCTENRFFGQYADIIQDDEVSATRLRVTLDKYVQSVSLHSNTEGLGLSRKEFRDKLLSELINTIFEFERKQSGKKIWIDKITPYVGTSNRVKEQLDRYFPHSPVIFLIRDGRDVCTSGVFHWLKKRPANSRYNEIEESRRNYFLKGKGKKPDRFFQDDEILEWARTWKEPYEILNDLQSARTTLILRYEDMLENTELTLTSLFEFLNVKESSKIMDGCVKAGSFRKMTQGRNPGDDSPGDHVRKGISGDWKNYFNADDLRLFEKTAGDMLTKFGYN